MFKAKICSDESCGMLMDGLNNSYVQGKVQANGLTSLPYLPALCAGLELLAATLQKLTVVWPLFPGACLFQVMEIGFFLLEEHLFLREDQLFFLEYWHGVHHPVKVAIPLLLSAL